MMKPVSSKREADDEDDIFDLIMENSNQPNERLTNVEEEVPNQKEVNFIQVDSLLPLFKQTLEEKSNLLSEYDIKKIDEFVKLDRYYQYFVIKLFLFLPKWYRFKQFCSKIKLDQKMSTGELSNMLQHLEIQGFVETDLKSMNIESLLNMLSKPELDSLLKKFYHTKKTKLQSKSPSKKEDVIKDLLKKCRTQTTLSLKKPEDLLKSEILKNVGYSIKLREDTKLSLYRAYLLQTFSNSLYIDPKCYIDDMNRLNVIYPTYEVEDFVPFNDPHEFSRYCDAVLLKQKYFTALEQKNNEVMREICISAMENLRNIPLQGTSSKDYPDGLPKFKDENIFVSILTKGCVRLVKNHNEVEEWLKYLIEHYKYHSALGFWYKHLAHIYIQYKKDYNQAAAIVIESLEYNERSHTFDLVQLQDLNATSSKILCVKSHTVSDSYKDQLRLLAEEPIRHINLPTVQIKCQIHRELSTRRPVYYYHDEKNEKNLGTVEMSVLHYYSEQGYKGKHCEGRLLCSIFVLLFWDIIYYCKVPKTFLSKFQCAPLDMFSQNFYVNRKDEIEVRLKEISEDWDANKLHNVIESNWNEHSNETTIAHITSVTNDFNEFTVMYQCINRKLLSNILRRLVTNYRRYHSGLPDLFLWKPESLDCKFVEVKGEKDRLSLTQKLWIEYLDQSGADVEVCLVSGVGTS